MPKNLEKVNKFSGVYFRESAQRRHGGRPAKCFYILYKDPRGKQITEKVGWDYEGYSAAMANNIRGDRIQSIRHGDQLPRKKVAEVTLGQVWLKYNEWLETGKKRPQDDRYYYRKNLEPRFSGIALSQISPLDLEGLKRDLYQRGLADQTVKHNLVIMRQLFNKAIAWGLWQGENPVKRVKMPRLNNRRERFLTREEAEMLLNELACYSKQLHDMALLSLQTGLRAGEIFNVRWRDIDLENRMIHVSDPKNTESRKALMTEEVKAMFRARRSDDNAQEEYVFKSTKGERVLEISNSFARAVKRTGFNEGVTDPRQKVYFHSLRHTYCSWLALQGIPLLTISKLAGHKTLAMTERYSHLSPDHKRDAVNQLEQYLQEHKAETKDALHLPHVVNP
jgi:integrase